MDADVQHYSRANIARGDNAVRAGMFLARFDSASTIKYLNYAVPDDGADPTAAQIAELVELFTSRGLMPRLEYLPSQAPRLEAALVSAGFTVEGRLPLMACQPDELVVPGLPEGITIVQPSTMDEHLAALGVQFEAFGETEAPTPAAVESMMLIPIEHGGIVAMAVTDDGTVIGAAQCGGPIDGITELGGVAVAKEYRGRGIAGALTAYLTQAVFRAGARVSWLDPSGAAAQRVYERAGYRVVGERLYIALEPQE